MNRFGSNSLVSQLGRYGQPSNQSPGIGLFGDMYQDQEQGYGLGQLMELGASDQFSNPLSMLGQQQQNGGLLGQLGSLGGGGASGLLGLGQLGLAGIGSISGLLNSRKMMGLARDQLKHTKDVTNTNLTNQIQSYNTALSDRARTRAVMEGRDMESANRYIEENRLSR